MFVVLLLGLFLATSQQCLLLVAMIYVLHFQELEIYLSLYNSKYYLLFLPYGGLGRLPPLPEVFNTHFCAL